MWRRRTRQSCECSGLATASLRGADHRLGERVLSRELHANGFFFAHGAFASAHKPERAAPESLCPRLARVQSEAEARWRQLSSMTHVECTTAV